MYTAIDLFSGLGGFTLGAKCAGVDVIWSCDWRDDIGFIYRSNHQSSSHICEDLRFIDWNSVPKSDIILASPPCQGHSNVRGKEKAHHKVSRDTSWSVIPCIQEKKPRAFIIENVPGFTKWESFDNWFSTLGNLGYCIRYKIIDAADFSVPQNRRRLFIVGVRGSLPFEIPEGEDKHIPASKIIDWSSGSWNLVNIPRRAESTLLKYQKGQQKFGDKFLVSYYGSGSNWRSLSRPIGTIMTHNRWAVIKENKMRMITIGETAKFMGFPAHYLLPRSHKFGLFLLGNAVCPPVASTIIADLVSFLDTGKNR